MYYFGDKQRQIELKKILDSWLPTPFRHHAGLKGKGCDCIHFVMRVYEEAGIVKWRKKLIPDYPPDWHLHNTRELLSEGLQREMKIQKVPLDNLKNGDIILSHYGKAASHASIYFDGCVYQSVTRIGVCKISFKDRVFRRQMRFAYRIMK